MNQRSTELPFKTAEDWENSSGKAVLYTTFSESKLEEYHPINREISSGDLTYFIELKLVKGEFKLVPQPGTGWSGNLVNHIQRLVFVPASSTNFSYLKAKNVLSEEFLFNGYRLTQWEIRTERAADGGVEFVDFLEWEAVNTSVQPNTARSSWRWKRG